MNLFSDPLGAKPTILKNLNLSAIVRILMKYHPISRTEISKKTGISKATVSKLISVLGDENYLIEVGKKDSRGGKRQVLLGLNPEKAKNIVVDISLRETTMAVVDFSYNLSNKRVFKTVSNLSKFIKILVSNLKKIIDETKIIPFKIVLSVSGTVDSNLKKIYDVPLLNWKNILLADMIELLLHNIGISSEVIMENDANLGIISEVMLNSKISTRNKNTVFILVKEGIGLGLFLNNGFYFGRTHSAGEFGHMIINMNEVKKRKWLDLGGSEELERFVDSNNIDEYSKILGTGVLNVINGLDPDQVVFSGSITKYWDKIFPVIKKMIVEKTNVESPEEISIIPSAFKNIESPLLGGAIIGFRDYIEMKNISD